MKLIWLTDIHLNFLNLDKRMEFYDKLKEIDGNKNILITGDIAESDSICDILKEMTDNIKVPIYFVLGNHDFYGSYIEEVQNKISLLSFNNKYLHCLSFGFLEHQPKLSQSTYIIGIDGWADGRYGNYENSKVFLNDFIHIKDFVHYKDNKEKILKIMKKLADKDALELKKIIEYKKIMTNPKKFIILTHVPPFPESCTYKDKMSDDDYLPFFSSKATGDVLIESAQNNPNIEFLVLCGHTHGKAYYQPISNLIVKTGRAQYGKPEIQEIILI